MVGDAELARLAELLRLSSDTARSIAQARRSNQREICEAADSALDAAILLESIVGPSCDGSSNASLLIDRN